MVRLGHDEPAHRLLADFYPFLSERSNVFRICFVRKSSRISFRMRSSMRISKFRPLNPLESISSLDRLRAKSLGMRSSVIFAANPFRMRSSKKKWGVGLLWLTWIPSFPILPPSGKIPPPFWGNNESHRRNCTHTFCRLLARARRQPRRRRRAASLRLLRRIFAHRTPVGRETPPRSPHPPPPPLS